MHRGSKRLRLWVTAPSKTIHWSSRGDLSNHFTLGPWNVVFAVRFVNGYITPQHPPSTSHALIALDEQWSCHHCEFTDPGCSSSWWLFGECYIAWNWSRTHLDISQSSQLQSRIELIHAWDGYFPDVKLWGLMELSRVEYDLNRSTRQKDHPATDFKCYLWNIRAVSLCPTLNQLCNDVICVICSLM